MVRPGIPNPEEKVRLLHGLPICSGDVMVAYLAFTQGERVRFSSGTPNCYRGAERLSAGLKSRRGRIVTSTWHRLNSSAVGQTCLLQRRWTEFDSLTNYQFKRLRSCWKWYWFSKPVVAGSNPASLASYSPATGCGLAPTKRDGQVRLLSGEPG